MSSPPTSSLYFLPRHQEIRAAIGRVGGNETREDSKLLAPHLTAPHDARKMALFLDCAQFALLRLQQQNEADIKQKSVKSSTSGLEARTKNPYTLQTLAWVNSTCIFYASQGLLTDEPVKTDEEGQGGSATTQKPIKVFSIMMDGTGTLLLTPAEEGEDPLETFQKNILNLIEFKSTQITEEQISERLEQVAALTHQHAQSLLTSHYPFHYLIELFVNQVIILLRQSPSSSPTLSSKLLPAQIESFISIMVQMMYWVHRIFSEQTYEHGRSRISDSYAKIRNLEETVIPTFSTSVTEMLDVKLSPAILKGYRRKFSEMDKQLSASLRQMLEETLTKKGIEEEPLSISRTLSSSSRKTRRKGPTPRNSQQTHGSLGGDKERFERMKREKKGDAKAERVARGSKETGRHRRNSSSRAKVSGQREGRQDSNVEEKEEELEDGQRKEAYLRKVYDEAQRHISTSKRMERTGNRSGAYRELSKAIGHMLEAAKKLQDNPGARIELHKRVADLVTKANMLKGKLGSATMRRSIHSYNNVRHALRSRRTYSGNTLNIGSLSACSVTSGSGSNSNNTDSFRSRGASAIKTLGGDAHSRTPTKIQGSSVDISVHYKGLNYPSNPHALEHQHTSSQNGASEARGVEEDTKFRLLPLAEDISEQSTLVAETTVQTAAANREAKARLAAEMEESEMLGNGFRIRSTKFHMKSSGDKTSAPSSPTPRVGFTPVNAEIPPAPTTCAPPPPKVTMTPFEAWNEISVRLQSGIQSMRKFFEATTLQGKLEHLCDACMEIPLRLHMDAFSADDLLATLILCIIHAEPENLTGEAAFLVDMAFIFFPEATMDHRGYSITTFLCCVDYLKDDNNHDFDGLVAMMSKLLGLELCTKGGKLKAGARRCSKHGS